MNPGKLGQLVRRMRKQIGSVTAHGMPQQHFCREPRNTDLCFFEDCGALRECGLESHRLRLCRFAFAAQPLRLIVARQRVDYGLEPPFHRQIKLVQR